MVIKMFRNLPRPIKKLLKNGDFYVITFWRRGIINAQADYSEKLEYELLKNGFDFEGKFTSEDKVFLEYQKVNDKIRVQITLVKEV